MAKIPVSKAYAKWMDEDAERLNAMAELARKVAVTLPTREEAEKRAFCPTGSGNGVDNSCSPVSASDPSLKERVPFKPIGDGKNSDFIRVPSVDELTEALTGSNSSKGTKIGAAKDLPAGTPVALRIDIPAFNYSTKNMGKAIYAVTIHENKGGKSFGSPLAYEPMARLTGPVTFAAKEKEATKVATGEANKFPLATVKGNFDPSRVIPPDIDSWTPVGYDPKKAAYFYDKKTGREVMGGTDAVSVGNSVFVRVPKYGYRNAREHYRDVGFWGVEYRTDDCGRDADGKFGSGNKCAGDGDSSPDGSDSPSGSGKIDSEWFGTSGDAGRSRSTIQSDAGPIEVVERPDVTNNEYINEIETEGRRRGLVVNFDDAVSEMQRYSSVIEDDGPYAAFLGPACNAMSGNACYEDAFSGEIIDLFGREYGAIDDETAEDMVQERADEILSEDWDTTVDHESEFPGWSGFDDAAKQAAKLKWFKTHRESAEDQARQGIDETRLEARENAILLMRKDLERELARTELECCLQLYRGLSLSSDVLDRVIREGRITHEGANSWTTSRGVARAFGGNRVLLVLRNPAVGHIYGADTLNEKEVTRPPSTMRIVGMVKTKGSFNRGGGIDQNGIVLYVEEDPDYKNPDERKK